MTKRAVWVVKHARGQAANRHYESSIMWGFGLWDLRGYRSLRVRFSWLALYRGPDDRVTAEAMLAWSTQNRHAARWFHSSYSKMLAAFISSPHLKRLLTTISEYVTDQPERLTVGEMA